MEYLIVKECHAQLDYFKQRRHSRTVVLLISSIYPNLIVQKLMIFLRKQLPFWSSVCIAVKVLVSVVLNSSKSCDYGNAYAIFLLCSFAGSCIGNSEL
jgi:hypothetical protein